MSRWRVNIEGRIYEGRYRTAADAVFGAMRTDQYALDNQQYDDLAIHVAKLPVVGREKHRSTTGCKRVL